MVQTSTKTNLREERDFSEKLNATFKFIRNNFKPLSRAILFYVTPVALAAGICSGLYQARLLQRTAGDRPYSTMGEYNFFNQVTSLQYFLTAFLSFLGFVMLSLTVYSYMVAYMDQDEEVQPADVWVHIKSNLLKVMYSTLAIGVICGLSMFLLGLGVYLGVVLSVFVIVMVREETGFVESIERCFYLVKGNWWATCGLILVVGFIQGMMGLLASLPMGVISFLHILQVPGMESDLLLIVANALSSVLGIFLYSIMAIALGFQYFNLVEKKDGTGLLEQVERIGYTEAHTIANEGEY
jgi:hypothetical protein